MSRTLFTLVRGTWARTRSSTIELDCVAERRAVLTVVSPAKSLDFTSKLPTRKHTLPRLAEHTVELVTTMAAKTPAEIGALMSISSMLAELNFDRFQEWQPTFTRKNARPAMLAFAGDTYIGLDALATFSERDYTHAQKVLRLLSGLHGVLRPLDLIQPYRLEMGSRLQTDRGRDLYQFWGDRITDVLNADLAESPGPAVLVNLASQEYFGAVRTAKLDATVITPTFLDPKDGGGHHVVSFFAKRARGAMAGWIVRNRIHSARALRDFDGLGYAFNAERSTRGAPVFVRNG